MFNEKTFCKPGLFEKTNVWELKSLNDIQSCQFLKFVRDPVEISDIINSQFGINNPTVFDLMK